MKRKYESFFGIDSRLGSRHGDGAAQTKDFGLQVSFYFLIPKQPPKPWRNPVLSFPWKAVSSIHISNIVPELTCNPRASVCGVCVCVWNPHGLPYCETARNLEASSACCGSR